MQTLHFTLYSRSYCHLCEDMLEALLALQTEQLRFEVAILDVDADPALVAIIEPRALSQEWLEWRLGLFAAALWGLNLLILVYGVGGLLLPFAGIKAVDLIVNTLHLV